MPSAAHLQGDAGLTHSHPVCATVSAAFAAAIAAGLEGAGPDFMEDVARHVAAVEDGDGTVAASCGALPGAVQGHDAVPLRWRRRVLGCRPVALPGVRHPRPAACWADDAMDLAEALAMAA